MFNKLKINLRPYLAWLCVAMFFFYQYVLRVFPAITVDQIRSEFKITAEQFSTFGSYYLIGYSLLQIPLGVIVDRIGVRMTTLVSIAICIIGALLLSTADTLAITQVSRFITGIGSAAAFICCLKIITDQIPFGKRGFLMGATLAVGVSGPILFSMGVGDMISSGGWRQVISYLALIGIALLSLNFILIKKDSNKSFNNLNKNLSQDLICIVKDKRIMIYAILAIGLYTPLSVLADLWGTAFLKQKFQLNDNEAPYISMIVYMGLAFGSIILPYICEKYNFLNKGIMICGIFIFLFFCLIVYGPQFSKDSLIMILFGLGFFCGAEMMCFTGALQFAGKNNSGEIIGVVNTFNMLGGAALHYFIGLSLDYQWDGKYVFEGIRFYNTDQFINSLSILTLVILLCCMISLKLKKY